MQWTLLLVKNEWTKADLSCGPRWWPLLSWMVNARMKNLRSAHVPSMHCQGRHFPSGVDLELISLSCVWADCSANTADQWPHDRNLPSRGEKISQFFRRAQWPCDQHVSYSLNGLQWTKRLNQQIEKEPIYPVNGISETWI